MAIPYIVCRKVDATKKRKTAIVVCRRQENAEEKAAERSGT